MGCQKAFEGRLFYQGFTLEVVFTKKTTFVSQMAVVAEKVLWRGAANCSLTISSPSLVLGSKLHGLLTYRTSYTDLQSENDPSCRCCWGILWIYFFISRGFFVPKKHIALNNRALTLNPGVKGQLSKPENHL